MRIPVEAVDAARAVTKEPLPADMVERMLTEALPCLLGGYRQRLVLAAAEVAQAADDVQVGDGAPLLTNNRFRLWGKEQGLALALVILDEMTQ